MIFTSGNSDVLSVGDSEVKSVSLSVTDIALH